MLQKSWKNQWGKTSNTKKTIQLLLIKNKENISDYFVKILTLTNQMKNNDNKVEDLTIVEKILRTIPSRFDYIVVDIEELKDLSGMLIKELQGILEAHKKRLNGWANDRIQD